MSTEPSVRLSNYYEKNKTLRDLYPLAVKHLPGFSLDPALLRIDTTRTFWESDVESDDEDPHGDLHYEATQVFHEVFDKLYKKGVIEDIFPPIDDWRPTYSEIKTMLRKTRELVADFVNLHRKPNEPTVMYWDTKKLLEQAKETIKRITKNGK